MGEETTEVFEEHPSIDDSSYRLEESNPNVSSDVSANQITPKPSDRSNIDISSMSLISSGCDDTNMIVEVSRGKLGDKKINFCYYCHTKQQKISRHLENKHKGESDVMKFLDLPKGSTERRDLIGLIRKKGNFLFNTKEAHNDGQLIVSRRPQGKYQREAIDYRACPRCKGFFSKATLRIHIARCINSQYNTRKSVKDSKMITGRLHRIATDTVRRKLFPPLRDDRVVRAIRYDSLVIIYANKMTAKYKHERYFEMIRQRLRLLGRFLLSIKEYNKEITDFSSVFDPAHCDDAHRAINKEAQLDMEAGHYKIPTVASGLSTLIKQMGSIFINECIKAHDEIKRKNTEDFLKLFVQDVNIYVNRTVVESQLQHQRRQKVVLPCMDDIKKFTTYLSSKRSECLKNLYSNYEIEVWKELSETTLLCLQLFNRKRAGEIERLLIEDFNNRQGINEETNKDLFCSLSRKQQIIAKKYMRILIRGKLNRTVPVLVSTHDIQCIELILKFRKKARVPKENPYVFGTPCKKNQYFRSCTLMRKYSVTCGAKDPDRIRGTKLRKHIATMAPSLNLTEQDVSDLASFLGHAETIHKNIYRQPVAKEILRMSKVLETAQGYGSNTDTDSESEINGKNFVNSCDTPNRNISSLNEIDIQDDVNRLDKEIARKRSTSPYGSVKRRKWTNEEKMTCLKVFKNNLETKTLPSFRRIQQELSENPCLKRRTIPQIKTWLHNYMRCKEN